MKLGQLLLGVTWKAVSQRTTVIFAGLAGATSLLFQSGTLFVASVGSYAALMLLQLSRGHLWRQALSDMEVAPVELPPESSLEEPTAKLLLARLTNARLERVAVLRGLETTVPNLRVRACAAELERNALVLIRGLDRLSRQCGRTTAANLVDRTRRLEQYAEFAENPYGRAQGEHARAASAGRLHALQEMEAWRGMVSARLEAIVTTIEALPGRLVRADAWRQTSQALQDDRALIGLREELENLDAAALSMLEQQTGQGDERTGALRDLGA